LKKGDDIVEVVTDKAAFTIPAEKDGVIKELLVKEGDEVKIGARLAVFEYL